MYTPYVRISNGNNPYTTLDATARNPLGSIYAAPVNEGLAVTTKGYGAQPVIKYVYYNSTTNPTPVAFPAPVYWTDESFTTVSGNAAEAFTTTGLVAVAGYLLPNTASISGLTAAQLNQSYCFIQIGGLLVGGYAPGSTAIGDTIIGIASGNFVAARLGAGTAATSRPFGTALTAIASGVADILLGGSYSTFWGS